MKKYLQKASRLFLWILGVIFSLILLSLILIQIPSIQNVAKEKVVAFIQEKIKTKVSIDRLKIAFPQTILLEGIYFEGQNKETLLAGKKMAVDISIWQLVNNKIILNSIDLNGIQATIKRDNKGTFNFDYIIEAFNSPQQQPKDSTAAPMVLRLNEINLDTIAIQYTDSYSKNNFALNLGHLDTKISTFDLDEMNFSVPKIKIKGLQLKLKQGISTVIPVPEKVDNTKSNLNIAIGEVDLSKIAIDYEDQKGKLTTTLALKKAFVKFEKTDIPNQFILIDKLALSDAEAAVALGKLKEIVTSSPAVTNESNNWEVKLRELSLKRIGLDYNNNAIAAVQKGMDYNHIKLSSLSTEAKFIRYNPISISGTINSFQVKEKSGLVIESFKSNFFYGRKNTFFKNLYLKTPQTEIKDEIQIGYQSIDNITTNLGDISIIAQLKKSRIGFKDILLLVPSLATTKPFDSNPNAVLLIDSKINGKLNAIKIPKLEVSGIGSTKINASGTITGLPDVAKAQFDLVLHELKTSAKDINQWTPKGSIPNSIQLPAALQVSGIFKGTINDFYTDLVVGSSFGPAKIKAQFNQTIKTKEKYSVNANLLNFDLGKLLKNNELGKVSLQTTIKGTGLDPKTASTELNGTIQKLTYNKYTYQNIALQGGIQQGLFNVEGNSNDSNLTLDLISSGSFKDKYPTGTLQLNVDIADLEKLNLHAGPLKIRGVLTADIQSADIDYLNGSFTIKNLSIADDVNEFITDTIVVTALSNIDQNSLNFKSPFLNASLNGQYQLSKIGAALTASLSNYYSTTAHSKNKKTDGQAFDFKIGIVDSPLFAKLIPGIESLEPIAISGRYNSLNDSITINGNSPKLIYVGNTITNAVLQLDTKNGALVYSIMVDDFQNAQFQLPYVALTGTIANNSANYLLQIKDQKDQERYTLGGTVEATNGSNNIHFDPNTVLLNYEKWKIDADNLIQLGAKGFNIDKLALSKNNSSIEVQSTTNAQNAPIDIKVKDFKIETLSSVAEKSDLTISGNTNGTISLKNINSGAVFTTNLTIADFAYKKDTVGTINIQVDNEIANNYRANIAITGQDNQVNLDGIYNTGDHTMDFNLDVVKLNLKSIQGFTLGNLTESTGFFNGKFSINGTATQPKLNGVLKWNEIGFKLKPLNATFKSMNDAVSFTDEAIVFNQFTIKDEKDNDLVIDGKINSSNLDNLGFDLRLDATNFQALNSTEKDNDLYYGKLFLDNHLRIKGSLNSPVVDGNIKVNKDTELSIVMPQSDPSIADREGIVEFIDQDHPSIVKKVTVTENLSKTEIKGINASVNIEVDKAAALSIIIDKANGDFLQLKGEADLNGGIDPSGKTTLTGRYELSEGAYEMNFNFIKRKFDIKNGSYILWTGEPTTADINITAVYKNEAAPIDLSRWTARFTYY